MQALNYLDIFFYHSHFPLANCSDLIQYFFFSGVMKLIGWFSKESEWARETVELFFLWGIINYAPFVDSSKVQT
jgi:hypothetical protein